MSLTQSTQICVKCKQSKSTTEFSLKDSKTGRRRRECKECAKAWSRAHYARSESTRKKIRETNKKLVLRNVSYVRSALAPGCVDCGATDIRVLEFDHLGDKVDGVMQVARTAVSLERVQAEIDKCEIRCLNCHRIKTHERAGWQY